MLRAVSGALAAITLLFVMGCDGGGTGTPPPDELVPGSADLIGQLHLDRVLDDEGVAELYAAAATAEGDDAPATLQGLLDLAQEEIGVDLREFSQVVIFANNGRNGFFGLIANGTFDQDTLLQLIEEAADAQFSTTDYKGHELRSITGPEDDEDIGLVFLDEETLVVGLTEAVRQVVDVLEGDRQGMAGEVMDTYNNLGDPWLKMAFEIPASALDGISEVPPPPILPIDLNPFMDVQVIGMSLDKTGEDIRAQVKADFATEESAADAGNVINGALMLASGFISDQKTQNLLDKLNVTTNGSMVTLTFDTSITEIREIMESPPDLGTDF